MDREYHKMVLASPKYRKYTTVWVSIEGVTTCVMLGGSIPIPGGQVFYHLVGYKGLREESFIHPSQEELESLPRRLREPARPGKSPESLTHSPWVRRQE